MSKNTISINDDLEYTNNYTYWNDSYRKIGILVKRRPSNTPIGNLYLILESGYRINLVPSGNAELDAKIYFLSTYNDYSTHPVVMASLERENGSGPNYPYISAINIDEITNGYPSFTAKIYQANRIEYNGNVEDGDTETNFRINYLAMSLNDTTN